jgi:tetratricopeptide (TPR) repeat protein
MFVNKTLNSVALIAAGTKTSSQQGAHDLAIADFTEAIRLEPDNPQGFVLRAKEYRAIGDDASAANDEQKCREKSGKPL